MEPHTATVSVYKHVNPMETDDSQTESPQMTKVIHFDLHSLSPDVKNENSSTQPINRDLDTNDIAWEKNCNATASKGIQKLERLR